MPPRRHKAVTLGMAAQKPRLSAPKLASALRRAARGASTAGARAGGTLVLVAENQPTLFEVVGGHLDRDAVAGQGLDAVLFHLAGGVGHDLVTCIELHAVARIGKDFGDQSFELDQLFFRHSVYLQIDRRLMLVAVWVELVRSGLATQERNALDSLRLAAALRRAVRLRSVGLQGASLTTTTAVTARTFRCRGRFMGPRGVQARRWPSRAMLLPGARLAMPLGTAVFPGKCDADQPLDIAEIAHLLGACDQRDRDSVGAGARGAADAMDIGLGHVGQIEIHDMADPTDIAARGIDVDGDHGTDFAGAERRKHPLAVVLRLVAVNGIRRDPGLC